MQYKLGQGQRVVSQTISYKARESAYPMVVPHSDHYLLIFIGCHVTRNSKLQDFRPAWLLLPIGRRGPFLLVTYPHLHLRQSSLPFRVVTVSLLCQKSSAIHSTYQLRTG